MNIILTTYFTSNNDPQRNIKWKPNDFKIIKNWYKSLIDNKINGIIFHDNLSDGFIGDYTNEYIKFIKVNNIYNVIDSGYFVYYKYLTENKNIDKVFTTDISDVKLIQNPFKKIKEDIIYMGHDCAGPVNNNKYILKNFRLPSKYFKLWEKLSRKYHLVNTGVMGGYRNIMISFLEKMINEINIISKTHNNTFLDMPVANYIIYKNFINNFVTGPPVTSFFKKYEKHRKDVWFKHK